MEFYGKMYSSQTPGFNWFSQRFFIFKFKLSVKINQIIRSQIIQVFFSIELQLKIDFVRNTIQNLSQQNSSSAQLGIIFVLIWKLILSGDLQV